MLKEKDDAPTRRVFVNQIENLLHPEIVIPNGELRPGSLGLQGGDSLLRDTKHKGTRFNLASTARTHQQFTDVILGRGAAGVQG